MAKQAQKIAIETGQEIVHVEHIIDLNLPAPDFLYPGTGGVTRIRRFPLADHRRQQALRMAIGAEHSQEPHILTLAENINVAELVFLAAFLTFHGGHQLSNQSLFQRSGPAYSESNHLL